MEGRDDGDGDGDQRGPAIFHGYVVIKMMFQSVTCEITRIEEINMDMDGESKDGALHGIYPRKDVSNII